MLRRTFIQGAAASVAMLPLWPATGREQRRSPSPDGTTVVTREADQINQSTGGRFNPLDASIDLLDKFELPRISQKDQPEMYAIWKTIFVEPITYVKPNEKLAIELLQQLAKAYTNVRLQRAQSGIMSGMSVPPGTALASRWEKSANWSGAYVVPHGGNSFTEVSGGWIVPYPKIPNDPNPASEYIASVWVGLDGQRDYFNSSLPQIGTRHDLVISGNTVTINTNGWYQWWIRGQTPQPPNPVPILLDIGDRVFCDVQAKSPTSATVTMAKFAASTKLKNVVWCQTLDAPSSGGVQAQISGATAQWIVERPAVVQVLPAGQPPSLYELPHYSEVMFSDCLAIAAPRIGASMTMNERLDGARFIRMYDIWDDPQRAVTISSPHRLIPDQQRAFKVRYVGP